MKLTIKSLVLLTAFAVVGAVAGCSGSDGEPASLGSQISTPSLSTMPASQPSVAVSPTISGRSDPLTATAPKANSQPAVGSKVIPPSIRKQPATHPVHTPLPTNEADQKDAGKFPDKFETHHPQDPPSAPPVGDLPYKPDGNISPPMPDLPSLVAPVAQASEVWEPIKYDGQFRSLGAVTAHDVDVLELADGSYRAYYAVEDRKIMSSRSTDGLTWVKDSGVRISNVAFPNAVLLDNGDVRLFYQDGMSIGSSISSDSGITFTKESGLRVSLGFINGINLNNLGAPSTIRLSDGTYRMYFRGGIEDSAFWNGQQSYVFSASSLDALEFIVDPGIRVDPSQFNDGGTGAPPGYERGKIHWVDGNDATLEPDGSVQLYFFSGFCFGLCMAISEDGLEFNNYEQVMSELVTPMNELAGGNGRIPGDPSILRTSNDQRIMYFGQGGHDVEPHELWGVYIAEIKN
jgi:hypothetical protein